MGGWGIGGRQVMGKGAGRMGDRWETCDEQG